MLTMDLKRYAETDATGVFAEMSRTIHFMLVEDAHVMRRLFYIL